MLHERLLATQRGDVKYVPTKPCRKGHMAFRYTSSGHCSACLKVHSPVKKDATPERREAMARGDMHYFTGRPCPRGHLDNRNTKTGSCVSCGRERVREKLAAMRVEAPAKYRAWVAMENSKYKEQKKKANTRWRKAHKGIVNARNYKRHTLKLRACPLWLTESQHAQIRSFYEEAARRASKTGIPHDVDHIVPLDGGTVSGLHVPWNLRVLTATVNRKRPKQWAAITEVEGVDIGTCGVYKALTAQAMTR